MRLTIQRIAKLLMKEPSLMWNRKRWFLMGRKILEIRRFFIWFDSIYLTELLNY